MEKKYTLEERVELADTKGSLEEISQLILELYEEDSEEALDLILKLALYDFGGITMKSDFQNLAVIGALHWGIHGLKKLGKVTIEDNGYRAINNITRLLSYISSKSLDEFSNVASIHENVKVLDIGNEKYKTDEWTSSKRSSY